MIKVAILTASDKGARGEREDKSAAIIREMLAGLGEVIAYDVVADERQLLAAKMREFCDLTRADLVLTTGGTGFSPRDVTPEATREVIEREVPGLPEAMRAASLKVTPQAMLSRAVAGIRGQTLIVNLPGALKGCGKTWRLFYPSCPMGWTFYRAKQVNVAGFENLESAKLL